MNPEDIRQVVIDAVNAAIPKAVEKTVNGHIRDLNDKLEKHIENTEKYRVAVYAHMDRMRPVEEGLTTLQSINKFVKYLGLPAIGVFIMWLFSKYK